MRSLENSGSPVLATTCRLSPLSIVIDDFDSIKNTNGSKESNSLMPEVSLYQPPPKPYTRQSSDASIKKILEEVEHRKNEFWKLIDEHKAVIENLKKIEQLENSTTACKVTQQPPIRT